MFAWLYFWLCALTGQRNWSGSGGAAYSLLVCTSLFLVFLAVFATTVQGQSVVGDLEVVLLSDLNLTFLDFSIEELFHPAAVKTNQMVVVRSFVELEHSFTSFKMIALQEAGLLELGQYAVNRCQSDIKIVGQQNFIDIFCTQMPDFSVLENFKDFEPWQSRFEAAGFEFGWIIRHVSVKVR
ncbi:hypothetical protein FHW67_002159 [Herbaspirillum sp. Sphag1AN]|nr:hypothetical protein [Herbaspirillum sp. Sphag1AN]MBB3246068.1 hypothetical protein [Herbaspirillum sp. Sphag64]